jgi:peptide-methionine (S)-S-oxide reductase
VLGGQHLLSDALGGYMLGTAWLIVALIYLVGPGYAAGEGRRAGELALPTAWLRYELGNLVPAVNMSVGNETTMTMRSRPMAATEKAILAGGCFWGVQDLVRKLDGVSSTRVGYTGGDTPNATYRNHGSHAEAIEILFDPERISYRDLLEFFFQIHDPTTKNRQGNDVGASYRSAIYYVDDEQRRIAEDTIADVDASGLWPGKVVTEVEPAGPFWEAEPEHQDYLERYPNGYTCHFVRPGWKLPRRTQEATR